VFRRNSTGATDATAQGSLDTEAPEAPVKSRPAAQTGKGRPTPKRSAAEANRYRTVTGSTTNGRSPVSATDTKRKLTPEEKAKARSDRSKQMAAMRSGEEWALGPRDRGPVKKLARDYVDAHRRPMEFYMYALIILVIVLFAGKSSSAGSYLQLLLLAVIAVIAVDGFFLRRSVMKLAAERYPGESTRGVGLYAIMRALQVRRFRSPAARLKPGQADQI
jgi:hypothetical protein